MESERDMISRVEMMAQGNPKMERRVKTLTDIVEA